MGGGGRGTGGATQYFRGNYKRDKSDGCRRNASVYHVYPISRTTSEVRVKYMFWAVAPVAYQGILEPGVGQFREFESPRVHTRIYSRGFLLGRKLAESARA